MSAIAKANIVELPMTKNEFTVLTPKSASTLVELKQVCKSYGEGKDRVSVLENINLSIREGEFIAIVGFSGSGKTTLISMIAGLIQADSGQVLKSGQAITAPGPDRGVVFQNYSLMPWLTVYENVALAVDAIFKDWTPEQRKAHAEHYIRMVNLGRAMDKKPSELSGGMRQRVNVARHWQLIQIFYYSMNHSVRSTL